MINWYPGITVENAEREIILQSFKFYGENKTATAQAIGISIRTLDAKLDKYKEDDLEKAKRILASAGSGVEPNAKVSEKQSVPMQERKEVQKVLPQPNAKSNHAAK